jgi:transcriptional regulator with AAA-type ATPase domain
MGSAFSVGNNVTINTTHATEVAFEMYTPWVEWSTANAIGALTQEIALLRAAVTELTELIGLQRDAAEARGKPVRILPKKAISDDAAKAKIKAYFEQRHGQTVYPSDVAEELRLEYSRTVRLINELESNGQVARA